MTEKTRALVLHFIKYRESQFIVDFLTESHGRLSFVVQLSKSSRGKVKRQYIQPLMILNIEFEYRPKLELQHLIDIAVAYPYSSIPISPTKISLVLFLAEFLSYATRYEQSNQALFDFVMESLVWLDRSLEGVSNFHVLFLLKVSVFLGIAPDLQRVSSDSCFDMLEGCFVQSIPAHSHFLSVEDSRLLTQLARLEYKTMNLCTMTRQQRNHCVEVALEYYALHIPGFPKIKSLPILKELFD